MNPPFLLKLRVVCIGQRRRLSNEEKLREYLPKIQQIVWVNRHHQRKPPKLEELDQTLVCCPHSHTTKSMKKERQDF